MNILEIFENETVRISSELESSLIKLNSEDKFPFIIKDSKLSFDEYIVGDLQVGDDLIRINPRHDSLSLSDYFDMILFINSNSTNPLHSNSFNLKKGFGVDVLIENFLSLCSDLCSFGLTGVFNSRKGKSFNPIGRINFKTFNKKSLLISGLEYESEVYQYDHYVNQIIKIALVKISKITHKNLKSKSLKILRYFQSVSDIQISNQLNEKKLLSYYTGNPFYGIVIEYSIKIIKGLKLGYNNNSGLMWKSFLVNSNNVLEEYIRTILMRGLENKVEKWTKPVAFGKILFDNNVFEKTYSPDIIIDYYGNSSRSVFDVKNKKFNPFGKLNKNISNPDIYQLLFYADQLNCNLCGLIYPSKVSHDPIKLNLNRNQIFFVLSVNFTLDIDKRHHEFLDNINNILNYT